MAEEIENLVSTSHLPIFDIYIYYMKITLWKITSWTSQRPHFKQITNVVYTDTLTLKIHSNINLRIFLYILLSQRQVIL